MEWTITEEDHKLSEIVDKALHEQRQRIHTDEGIVVVISEEEFERIGGKQKSFVEHLMSIPKGDVEFPRDKSPMREFDW
jgi:antitoxin Phd